MNSDICLKKQKTREKKKKEKKEAENVNMDPNIHLISWLVRVRILEGFLIVVEFYLVFICLVASKSKSYYY